MLSEKSQLPKATNHIILFTVHSGINKIIGIERRSMVAERKRYIYIPYDLIYIFNIYIKSYEIITIIKKVNACITSKQFLMSLGNVFVYTLPCLQYLNPPGFDWLDPGFWSLCFEFPRLECLSLLDSHHSLKSVHFTFT